MHWPRALGAWLMIAIAETIHGIARRILLVPRMGQLRSSQIGVLVGSIIILSIAWATIRWIGARTPRELWALGAVWTLFMLGFEFLIGLAAKVPLDRILADYDLTKGGLMILGMLVMLASPSIAARLRRII